MAGGGCASLRAQLEEERLGLQRLERHIRRAAQRSQAHRNVNTERGFQNPNNRVGPRLGKNNFYQDGINQKNTMDDRIGKKRPQETKTVFSRLSARPAGDSDGEDEQATPKKPRLSSQVIRDLPTKQEVLKAQEGDEQSKARNKRMFGSLLGTLQKFKQEAIVLQNKEDKKAQVEKKIEEQAKQEKENQKKERQNLFASREIKKATIKSLEAKMVRMREFEKWEVAHTTMFEFIQTKGKPQIFWKPKRMSERAEEKLANSKKILEKILEKKKQDVTSELNAIEQRCLRNMRLPPGSQLRPTTLSGIAESGNSVYNESMEVDNDPEDVNSGDERVHSSSVIIKVEKDKSEKRTNEIRSSIQIKQETHGDVDKKIENGKSHTNEKWNRDDSNTSSDDNEDNSNGNGVKDHSMDESSHINNEKIDEEDPGGVNITENSPDDDNNILECETTAANSENIIEKS